MVWYDWDTNNLEHSIKPISQSKHHSGEHCINTLLLSSGKWISYVIQCDVYQFITMTRPAASPENCKNGNVTRICIQGVTVYHCTLLMLSKAKSVFAVSPMAQLWPHELFGGTRAPWALVACGMKEMRHFVSWREKLHSGQPISHRIFWKCLEWAGSVTTSNGMWQGMAGVRSWN